VTGLSFLHQHHVLHRDIKSKNIFRFSDGRVVIGDFGACKSLVHTMVLANTVVGSPLYMSPELLDGQPYSFSSDIWSLGCLLYELFAGTTPFVAASYPAVLFRITKGTYGQLPSSVPEDIQSLVARMLSLDPAQRPTVEDLLLLPAIQSRLIDSQAAPRDSLMEGATSGSDTMAIDIAVVAVDGSNVSSSYPPIPEASHGEEFLLPPPPPMSAAQLITPRTKDPPLPSPPPQTSTKPQHKSQRTNVSIGYPTNRASIANVSARRSYSIVASALVETEVHLFFAFQILSRERLHLHKDQQRQAATTAGAEAKFLSCVPVVSRTLSGLSICCAHVSRFLVAVCID
jgi:serine/threonine protein kinase